MDVLWLKEREVPEYFESYRIHKRHTVNPGLNSVTQ